MSLIVPYLRDLQIPATPLVEELSLTLNAWDVARRFAHRPHLLFLDSAITDLPQGRYSYITADPFDWLRTRGKEDNPFPRLEAELARFQCEPVAGLPPFQGGIAGLCGYDLCHHLERLPRPRGDEFETPDLAVGLYDWVVAFDHHQERSWIISTGFPEIDPVRRKRRAERRLQTVKKWLREAPQEPPDLIGLPLDASRLCPQYTIAGHPRLTSNFDHVSYLATVRRAIEYIHAGDCFQVNVAQRLLTPQTEHPLVLYGRLRERNAAPFSGYFDLGDFAVVSASPERFLYVEGGNIETRPIKGTRPRGVTPAEDRARIEELRSSTKDRAENVMIVDLLRNDLGRVCEYGSVLVEAVCRVETFRHVHHLVSEVRGRLRQDLGPVDLLKAAFPGGSVTGAPKIRAMEIIAELEPTARGPYCGSLGYISFDGTMDTSILIRTFMVGRGWVQFPVGGGIVADSVPEKEYEETWHKAEGLLRALA